MIRVGVIGYGYWGPNIVRNFRSIDPDCVTAISDLNPKALAKAGKQYPAIAMTTDCRDILRSTEIDAVAVITPVATHYSLVREALENGKHVFVEKPFTDNVAHAEELLELADRKKLKIMVDHTFLFTGAVKKIKELIDKGTLGKIYYFDSMRVNLGLFQTDVNVVWDLAPHDLSIMQYLISEKPQAVVATGENHVNGKEDIAYITVYLENNIIAHFNVNWLSPVKVRMTLIGGEQKSLVWNDLVADEKIRVYDKGVQKNNTNGVYEMLVSYRMGDVWAPRIENTEALQLETRYFIDCIENDEVPFNDARAGLEIVRILEATNKSLERKGGMIYL
ncbi:MAG TPA: Gfo/Idh/MocA family oxidoreductase [Acidobacteriota bacterium]|nr:Gfo/Idh/MocA family oxidoreductase [Acidobacteriota bacterium]